MCVCVFHLFSNLDDLQQISFAVLHFQQFCHFFTFILCDLYVIWQKYLFCYLSQSENLKEKSVFGNEFSVRTFFAFQNYISDLFFATIMYIVKEKEIPL